MLKAEAQEMLHKSPEQFVDNWLSAPSIFHLKVCPIFPVLENHLRLPDSETVESIQAVSSVDSLFIRGKYYITEGLQGIEGWPEHFFMKFKAFRG